MHVGQHFGMLLLVLVCTSCSYSSLQTRQDTGKNDSLYLEAWKRFSAEDRIAPVVWITGTERFEEMEATVDLVIDRLGTHGIVASGEGSMLGTALFVFSEHAERAREILRDLPCVKAGKAGVIEETARIAEILADKEAERLRDIVTDALRTNGILPTTEYRGHGAGTGYIISVDRKQEAKGREIVSALPATRAGRVQIIEDGSSGKSDP
ncbi:MAG: hypothetical protein JXR37_04970 [Kiritimatiellae bacterium]|nr:hypothetical protein [Kiritimatiellia bacterium]